MGLLNDGLNLATLGAYGAITGNGGPFGNTAGPSGVGGPAADPTKLVHDPATGMYFDPTTGTSYMDPTGQNPIKDPNVAQQVSQNVGIRNQYLGQQPQDRQMVTDAYGRETGLADSLNNTISNPNAPSVAQGQLTQGADMAASQQLANAAGVGGANAGAARRQASINLGSIGSDLAQSKALARANEIQNAQQGLAGVLGNQGSQGLSLNSSDTNAAHGFAALAQGGASDQQNAQLGVDAANKKRQSDYVAGLENSVAGAGTKMAMG